MEIEKYAQTQFPKHKYYKSNNSWKLILNDLSGKIAKGNETISEKAYS